MRAVSRCVDAHPGPVRGVRLTHVSFYHHEYALRRLVSALAVKKVWDLILFNRPWPLDMPLPDDILFRCASLERLYLGVWRFHVITAARPPALDKLRDLGLFHCIICNEDLEALLAHCPKLEVSPLSWVTNPRSVFVSCSAASRSFWIGCLTSTRSSSRTHPVSNACYSGPCSIGSLSRLFPRPGWRCSTSLTSIYTRLRLAALQSSRDESEGKGHGSKLEDTGCQGSVCTQRGGQDAAHLTQMLPLPGDAAYHARSIPDTTHDLEFWESLCSCECLESHLKMVIFHGFLTQKQEIEFLNYISREGKVIDAMLGALSQEMVENCNSDFLGESDVAEGGGESYSHPGVVISPWSFQNATDLALDDPFCMLSEGMRCRPGFVLVIELVLLRYYHTFLVL